MKAEELMKPRFEVIADYPFPKNYIYVKVGGIVETKNKKDIVYFSQYPHLFRKLNWWEHRDIEDMPKRLISKCTPTSDEIFEIEEWDMERLLGWINKGGRDCCDLTIWTPEYGYFPVD